MADISMKTHLNAPAADVWKTIGQFNGLPEWNPMIEKSELKGGGQRRQLSLPDGSKVVEDLMHLDDDGFHMTYAIVDSPLPIMNYRSDIKVIPDAGGKGCTVEWSSTFEAEGDPNAAIQAIQGIYQSGLDNLKKMYGGS